MKKKKIVPVVALAALLGLGITTIASCSSNPTTTDPTSAQTSEDPTPSSTSTGTSEDIKTGTVTVSTDNHGKVVASATSGKVGDIITLTVTPNDGYELDTLLANKEDVKATKQFALKEGVNTVTATFKQTVAPVNTYTVTYTTSSDYTIKGLKESYEDGAKVEFSVTASEGKQIVSVKANTTLLTGVDGVYSFTISENTAITVEVKDKDPEPVTKYTVTYTESLDYTITGISSEGYAEGDKVSFSVSPSEGKEIVAVQKDGVDLTPVNEGSNNYEFTMGNANVVISVTTKDVVVDLTLKITMSKTTFTEGDGAELLVVAPNNESLTLQSVTWDVSGIDGIGQLNEVPSDHPSAGVGAKFFVPTGVGSGTIKISAATTNGLTLEGSIKVTVNANYATYTEISTASQLIDLLERSGTVAATEKYYLSNNIDLGGMELCGRDNGATIDGENGLTFSGVLDGRGHSISNFTLKNTSRAETDKCAALFHYFNGTMRNVSLIGKLDCAGFGGMIAKEVNGGLIDNVYIELEQVRTGASTDWTWCRNGVIAGVIQGNAKVRNVVTKLTADTAWTMPFFAYSWGTANISVDNLYTNVAHDTQNENYVPFSPDGSAQIDKTKFTNLKNVDYASATVDSYDLDTNVWTLKDGETPKLAHTGETPVVVTPEVSVVASATSVTIGGDDVTLTATVKNGTATGYDYTITEGSDLITVTPGDGGSFLVKGVKAGVAKVKVHATVAGVTYNSEEVSITVLEAGESEYIEVSPIAKGASKTRFEGAGAHVWVKATDLGITSNDDFVALNNDKANKVSVTIDQKDGAGNAVTRKLVGLNLQDYNVTEDYIDIYSNYDGAPGADYKTTITIIVKGSSKDYKIVASFTGNNWDDPNPSEEPEGPSTYVSITPLEENAAGNKTRVEGAGVWIWVNANDIEGLEASTISKLSVVNVTLESKTPSGDDTGWKVNNTVLSDYVWGQSNYFRVYVELNGGPADGYTTKVDVKLAYDNVGYEIVANFTGTTYVPAN